MQKITPAPSGNINLQPKIHTTTQSQLRPAYKTSYSSSATATSPLPKAAKQAELSPQQQWTPFQPYFQQQDTDTDSTNNGSASEDSEDSQSSEDSYHSPPRSPNPLQRHLQWLDEQRRRAQQALAEDDNAIIAFRPPPPPPTPPAAPLPPQQQKQQLCVPWAPALVTNKFPNWKEQNQLQNQLQTLLTIWITTSVPETRGPLFLIHTA